MTRSRHRREHEIQKAIAHFLREHWPDLPFVGSVNGAFLGGGRLGAIRWNALRTTGSSSGYPDVFVHWRGAFNEIGLAVEVKVLGARLQPRQQEWRTRLVRAGAVFVVVHSLDEFVQALNSYLGDTPAPAAESDNSADSMQRADEALDEAACCNLALWIKKKKRRCGGRRCGDLKARKVVPAQPRGEAAARSPNRLLRRSAVEAQLLRLVAHRPVAAPLARARRAGSVVATQPAAALGGVSAACSAAAPSDDAGSTAASRAAAVATLPAAALAGVSKACSAVAAPSGDAGSTATSRAAAVATQPAAALAGVSKACSAVAAPSGDAGSTAASRAAAVATQPAAALGGVLVASGAAAPSGDAGSTAASRAAAVATQPVAALGGVLVASGAVAFTR
ncbi:hypothetical protein EMIHUDRAFT_213374 [Emiliania huxleyi CCMP1516]|uniref:VRR-NUC domain-containing protein n=2 Tax=Emiliania huxleyi TaxID=2903 RepID=A0A0D3IMZ8_EMIH1|nr:hypothetical protein EMIHUDRAFT_213374 [Emiliania huxleyi CCMP1516]EOD12633.1 hypothetical protein EMIHUDRAFT_213374 [Emiliania huxleyi CCMP1516]|eukprot:XP_005765062.1 hypothetical protein EMIHUDRAFT_213374 [Emiliania huxleyi CCMP1516]